MKGAYAKEIVRSVADGAMTTEAALALLNVPADVLAKAVGREVNRRLVDSVRLSATTKEILRLLPHHGGGYC